MSSPKFRCQIFDPADAVAIFQERLDQENVRLMFSDQFARVVVTMGAAANMISLVASDDCGQALFTDTRVRDHHDASWFQQRTRRTATRTSCSCHRNSIRVGRGGSEYGEFRIRTHFLLVRRRTLA